MPSRRNLVQSSVGAMGWTSLSVVLQFATKLLALSILARLLGPTEFGLMAGASMFFGLGKTVIFTAFGQAYIRELEPDENFINAARVTLPIAGAVMALTMGLLAGPLSALVNLPAAKPIIEIMSLAFLLQGISTVAEYRVIKKYAFRNYALIDYLSSSLIYAVVAVGCALAGLGVWSLVYGTLAGLIFRAAAFLAQDRTLPDFANIHRPSLKRYLRTGFGFTSANSAYALSNTADSFVVARMLGADALGLYSRAYELMKYPTTLYNKVVGRVALLSLSEAQDDRSRLTRGHNMGLALMAALGFPMAALLFCYAEFIVLAVLGDQWLSMVLPFRIFCICIYFRVAQRLPIAVHQAVGRLKALNIINILVGGLVLLLAVAGSRYGISGVAVGVSLAIAMNFVLSSWSASKSLDLSAPRFFTLHLPGLAGATIVLGSVMSIRLLSKDLPALLTIPMELSTTAILIILVCRTYPELILGNTGVRVIHQIKLPRALTALRQIIIRTPTR